MSGKLRSSLTSKLDKRLSQQERNQYTTLQTAYFDEVISESGIILSYNDSPNILTYEQSLVVRDIEKMLRSHISYPDNTEEFMMGLRSLCENQTMFQKALMCTQLRKKDDTNGTNRMQQESLFRLILNVHCLQDAAMDMILDGLVLHVSDDDPGNQTWLQLFLNTLRYLPYIKNPNKLSTKLLDCLEIAAYPAQIEILNAIPEIIPDGQCDEIARQLNNVLDEKPQVAGAIVDCLNLLNITSDTKAEIQDRILANLFSETYLTIFPILYEYLVTDVTAQNVQNILVKIRNVLDNIFSSDSNESNKTILLGKLRSSVLSSKIIHDGWFELISNIRLHADHKPVDLLLIFVLYSTNNMKKKATEALIKKKIKLRLLRVPLLEAFFNKYITQQFLKEYLPTLLNISSSLLQGTKNDPIITEFASVMYKLSFVNDKTDCTQHQDILHSLLLLSGSSELTTNTNVLKIIEDLDINKLQKHTLQLMSLLEKLDVFELDDVKTTFQILCGLTCGENADDSLSGLKDEIHMLVRKLLSSVQINTKHRGIIAAVIMAKYIASTSQEQGEINLSGDESISITDIPNVMIREAASLLELVTVSISSCAESMALYYDQLASILISDKNIDKHFLAWLSDSITNNFQNTFISETIPNPINDIELSEQFSLNAKVEIEVPIYINIAGLTINSKTNIILTLVPSFRVVRLLHFCQHTGDLSSIDALLGSGVIMPELHTIQDMDSDQIKQTADCIFHCINWFRENISAFVTQRSKQLRVKIIERLQNLIELEDLLNECLEYVPEHKLPRSYFNTLKANKQSVACKSDSKNPKRLRKNDYKSSEIVRNNESVASTSANTQTTKSTNTMKKTAREFCFREMDTDVMVLLRYPVKIDDDTMELSQITSTQIETLNIKQFCFILNEIVVSKLVQLTQKNKSTIANISSNVTPANIITDLVQFLPNVNKTLAQVVEILNKTTKQTDNAYDLPDLFTPHMKDVKNCFNLIIKCLSIVFSWAGFQHSKHLNLLRNCLKSLRDEQLSQLNSANQLILDFSKRLYTYASACLQLTTAVNLVKTLQALYSVNLNPEVAKIIISSNSKFLKRTWLNASGKPDTGKEYFANIDYLMKSYLEGADVKTIYGLVGTLQKQAPNIKVKTDRLPMLESIDKPSFPILFRGLCNALLERVRSEVASLTNDEHLILWRTTAVTLQGLMSIVKVQESRTNLVCFLKKSLGILKVFLTHGVPILEIMLRSKPDDVVEILKIMQTSTRFLHHLCCHSKLVKDTSLLAYVPQFRLTLETLVYRIKAALVVNNCSDSFWMGNLKNKDIHGEDILTQTSTDESEQQKSDDELPEDDSDIESLLQEESNETTSNSASEVFP